MTSIQSIPISKIKPNTGQIDGLPANPRIIKDEKYSKLKASIVDHPEFLQYNPLKVYPLNNIFIVIGGNMRYRACKDLGFTELPCIIIPEDTPADKLRAYTIKDNNGFGEWDYDMLANEWDAEDLEAWGVDVWTDSDDAPAEEENIETDDKGVTAEILFDSKQDRDAFVKHYAQQLMTEYGCKIIKR